jgi:undecaprenyl-diphosphatase
MDEIVQAVIIGVVQGLTEFLPISSSAHLTILPPLLGWEDDMLNSATFVVMLHMGTLAALLVYFRRDVVVLVGAGASVLRERAIDGDPDRRLAVLLAISVVPAAIVGALFEPFFDVYFRENLILIPGILFLGAMLLAIGERVGKRDRELATARLGDAAVIGLAQALALFPGFSRSGITIAAGLMRGFKREAAARFAFLIGIPITAGAGLWKLRVVIGAPPGAIDYVVLGAGMLAAAVSGWIAIDVLLRYLRVRSTAIFIWYRIVAAGVWAVLIIAQ